MSVENEGAFRISIETQIWDSERRLRGLLARRVELARRLDAATKYLSAEVAYAPSAPNQFTGVGSRSTLERLPSIEEIKAADAEYLEELKGQREHRDLLNSLLP